MDSRQKPFVMWCTYLVLFVIREMLVLKEVKKTWYFTGLSDLYG